MNSKRGAGSARFGCADDSVDADDSDCAIEACDAKDANDEDASGTCASDNADGRRPADGFPSADRPLTDDAESSAHC